MVDLQRQISRNMNILHVESIELTHILCSLWFPAFSAVFSLLCHYCYSCYTTKSKCAALTSSHNRNNSDGKASLKRQRTPGTTQDVSKFYLFYVLNVHISLSGK